MLAAYVRQVVTRHASIQTRKALRNLVAMLFVDSVEKARETLGVLRNRSELAQADKAESRG